MEKRFLSIWFPYLATDWHTVRQPALAAVPFVLKTSHHGRIIIAAANSIAHNKGITTGMVLADARAIIPSLVAIDETPALAEHVLSKMAEWCIRFTPVATIDLPAGLILDTSGCAHLWGGERAYVTDIYKRFKQRGYTISIGMADTIGAAWAIARYGSASRIIEKGKHLQALLTLPPQALRLDALIAEQLYKLGLTQISQFISMPRNALFRRFGNELMLRLQQALGETDENITGIIPAAIYQERLPCLESICHLAGIEIALQNLLEQLCKRLQKENKGLRNAFFKGYCVDGKTTCISIGTHRPSHNAAHLFKLFSIQLEKIEPGNGIELFVLEATTTEDLFPAQEKLWNEGGGLNNTKISELLDNITSKIGEGFIQRYVPDEHYWPERSFKKAASLNEPLQSEWRADKPRPVQLLTIPEIIEVTAPIPDYPPMSFRYKGKLHTVKKADGPERIEQEWWLQQGQHRDYYTVEDQDGHRYWLFRLGHYDSAIPYQWFIHGFFA